MLSRRAFLGWLASAFPAAAIVRRAHALAVEHLADDAQILRAIGEVVLPAELGVAGQHAAVANFQKWIAGYREGAELLHGYGTSALEFAGPTPATQWSAQIAKLGPSFASQSLNARRSTITAQLNQINNARIGNVGRSPHVALALLSHFYASPGATDLCYESRIGKQTCRPLAASTRKPLPLHS